MHDKTDQNRVRQVLMNELGLTRESVREEMTRIVADTIERALGTPDFQQRIDNIIETKVARALTRYSGSDELKMFVESLAIKEAEAQVRAIVREDWVIDVRKVHK